MTEYKAHSLTDAGRRGAPKRLEKKFAELVTKPAMQAGRFAAHLRAGGSLFTSSGRPLFMPISRDSVLPRMVVTYERIDPLATSAAILADGSPKEPAWVLPLADLLVVADLLYSPSIFWHYAVARWKHSQQQKLSVQSELDVLGLFLSNKTVFDSITIYLADEHRVQVGPSLAQALPPYGDNTRNFRRLCLHEVF